MLMTAPRAGRALPGPRRALVIVLNYNGQDLLRACLRSLEELRDREHVRVLVSDNGSTDGSQTMVRSEFPWVVLHENGENLGFGRGNNIVLARHEADDYILLNNDTEAHPGWLDAMQRAAEAADVGLVGARLLFPDGRLQHAGGFVDAFGPQHHGYLAKPEEHAERRDVDFVTFACALVKREVLERIGYMDEGFAPIYYEDADYCLRARAAGFRIVYEPDAVLLHKESVSMNKQPPRPKLLLQERNRLRLKFIHFPASWWLRGTLYEARKLAGNARKGTLDVMMQAWRENLAARSTLRARRKARAAFVPSEFGAPHAHAPRVAWPPEPQASAR